MAIISIVRDWGDLPAIVRINASTSTLAQVGTAGYLTAQADNIAAANNGAFEWQASDMVLVYASDGWGFFTISSDQTSLTPFAIVTGVTTPTTVGHIAVFDSTGGNIGEDAATAINGGNIQAGLSGTDGYLASFPSAAASGSFRVAAQAAGGNFVTTLQNAQVAQNTVVSIGGDVGASANLLVTASSFGRVKVVAAAAAAGGAAAQSFTDAFCTTGSVVIGNWVTQANPASVLIIVPGNGSFVVTSDADAGVGTFSYMILKP